MWHRRDTIAVLKSRSYRHSPWAATYGHLAVRAVGHRAENTFAVVRCDVYESRLKLTQFVNYGIDTFNAVPFHRREQFDGKQRRFASVDYVYYFHEPTFL